MSSYLYCITNEIKLGSITQPFAGIMDSVACVLHSFQLQLGNSEVGVTLGCTGKLLTPLITGSGQELKLCPRSKLWLITRVYIHVISLWGLALLLHGDWFWEVMDWKGTHGKNIPRDQGRSCRASSDLVSEDTKHYSAMIHSVGYAKLFQSCPTLCDPIDGSPPGSPVPGILQARTLEWVVISFSNAWKWKGKVKSLSRVWLFATPWTAAFQAPLSMGFSRQEYWSGVPLPSPLWVIRES